MADLVDLPGWAHALRNGPRLGASVSMLADWAVSSPWTRASEKAKLALRDAVTNLLAVTVGGAAMTVQHALVDEWNPEPGGATLIGTGRTATVEVAAWLNAVNGVVLERDEGNRFAKGHPAVQTAPVILALAERGGISGPRLWNALLVGYEIAARFGRATSFSRDVHTHGTFGVPGAAAGCAVLFDADAGVVARAIEAGVSLPPATNWATVFDGSALRDQWVGAGNVTGLAAVRYASSQLPLGHDGGPARLGGTLGTIDTDCLVDGLGADLLVNMSYLKQYSSCAYTHSAADAAIALRSRLYSAGFNVDAIVEVDAEVTGTALALDDRRWTTRPGAYFSVPFAVASSLVYGDVGVNRSAVPAAAELAELAERVRVIPAGPDVPRRIPAARPARVTVRLVNGESFSETVEHPQGDVMFTPFTSELFEKVLAEALTPASLAPEALHAAVASFDLEAPDAVHRGLHFLTPTG